MAQATEAQITLIKRLVSEKDTTAIDSYLDTARAVAMQTPEKFTTKTASALLDLLFQQPRKDTPAEVPEGMHKVGDRIYKVQVAVHGSGAKYAKELVQRGADAFDDGFMFEYSPGAIRQLSTETLMTLEDAKKFGALYGTCCVCGRTLTNEDSIAAGIGPVCAEKF